MEPENAATANAAPAAAGQILQWLLLVPVFVIEWLCDVSGGGAGGEQVQLDSGGGMIWGIICNACCEYMLFLVCLLLSFLTLFRGWRILSY